MPVTVCSVAGDFEPQAKGIAVLVLGRSQGEELILDISAVAPGAEPIRVKLVSVSTGRRARIGIEADPRVAVMRGERVQVEEVTE